MLKLAPMVIFEDILETKVPLKWLMLTLTVKFGFETNSDQSLRDERLNKIGAKLIYC